MRLRVYGCALKCVEVLASFFTCACSRCIFVSVCEFWRCFPRKREFIIFRASFRSSTKKKKLSAQRSEQSYFFSSLRSRRRRSRFPDASARSSPPLARAVPVQSARVEGTGRARAKFVFCLGTQISTFTLVPPW